MHVAHQERRLSATRHQLPFGRRDAAPAGWREQLWAQVLLGVLVTAFLIGGMLYVLWIIQRADNYALKINAAGRQRALTERYAKLVLLRDADAEPEARAVAARIEEAALAFLNGGTLEGRRGALAIPPVTDPELRHNLEQQLEGLARLVETGNQLLGNGDNQRAAMHDEIGRLREHSAALHATADALVARFEADAAASTSGSVWLTVVGGGFSLLLAWLLVFREAQNRRRVRREISERAAAEQSFREFVMRAPDAILIVDAKSTIALANNKAGSLFGVDPEALVATDVNALVPLGLADRHRQLVAEYFKDPTERAMGSRIELFARGKDGDIPVQINLSPIMIDGEQYTMAAVRDVTEQRKVDHELKSFATELQRSNTDLQRSNAELEQFAYVASHDLQEPLRKVRAFGERLVKHSGDSLDERGQDYVSRMSAAGERMQDLISDLLSLSRVTSDAKPFVEVDFNKLLADVLSDLETAIESSEATVSVNGQAPTIFGDPLQLRQLTQNLIGNALKFRRPETEHEVSIAMEHVDDNLRLTIRDNGIGFDPKYTDRIFGVFQRLHGRAAYEGTGIGLAICRKVVERHHGTISVESAAGDGATFIVSLPVLGQDSASASAADAGSIAANTTKTTTGYEGAS